MSQRILVGTASWADPGFIDTWYPHGLAKQELLPWYAQHFPLVEVNSSFYAIPEPKAVAHWVDQPPPHFVFDIKAHKALSRHAAKLADLPKDLRPLASVDGEKVKLTPALEDALLGKLLDAIKPLTDAGKLGAFLVQLSPSFSPKYHAIEELSAIIEALRPHGLAIELRNRNWMSSELASSVVDYFAKQSVSLVTVDAPDSPHFMVMPKSDVVTNPKLAYIRLHGRDAKAFTRGKTVSERFNYEYSPDELRETAATAQKLLHDAEDVHVVFNNNHANLAPKAAEYFMQIAKDTGLPVAPRSP